MKCGLRGVEFRILDERSVSGGWISCFGSKFRFQGIGFQDLGRHFGFSGVDLRIWDEVLVSAVSNFVI